MIEACFTSIVPFRLAAVSTPNLHSSSLYAPSLSPDELTIIRCSFSSQRTICFISSSPVTLYTCNPSSSWERICMGVPALLLNSGGARARTERGARLVLAERGTGLALWQDRLDNLSCYQQDKQDNLFHRMHSSRDHTVRVGLQWEDADAANLFLRWVEEIMANPENLGLSGPKQGRKVVDRRRSKINKLEISPPCGFRHIVSLSREDRDTVHSLMVNTGVKREH